MRTSGPMMSWTSPPEQKSSPRACQHDRFDIVHVHERAEQVAEFGVALEGERILRSGCSINVTVATRSRTANCTCRGGASSLASTT